MSLIFTAVDPFGACQKIYLRPDDGDTKVIALSTINELKTVIPALCKEYNVNDVRLYGGVEYLNKIAEDIQKENKTNYSQNQITIEVT
mgnify:CR=1 FL=1